METFKENCRFVKSALLMIDLRATRRLKIQSRDGYESRLLYKFNECTVAQCPRVLKGVAGKKIDGSIIVGSLMLSRDDTKPEMGDILSLRATQCW